MTTKRLMPVYFVGAGPGDPGLITVKGAGLLKKADIVVYAGSLVSRGIVNRYCKKAMLHDSAKMHLERIIEILKRGVISGKTVVRLHTGDTAFYSALGEQAFLLAEAGIPYEVVPGVSSASACAAILGKELTIPGKTQTVIFTRAGGRTPVPRKEDIRSLASHNATMCIFLSADKINEVVGMLIKEYPKSTPVAVIYRATWKDELKITGTLKDIAEKTAQKGITSHAVIMVGHAIGGWPREMASMLYNKKFPHSFRP
jgi:precorrin-4/cobalt-precorrin-4 C11-methyltransferase